MVLRNIELFRGHMARDKWQRNFWADKLEYLRKHNIFDEAICLSDFWKYVVDTACHHIHHTCHHHACTCRLFNGTWLRRANCDSGESMSVETHCVWSVAPTLEQLSAKVCLLLPKDIVEKYREGNSVFW